MLFTGLVFLWVLFSGSLVSSLNQLSFSGGGSLGAVEIGIVKNYQREG